MSESPPLVSDEIDVDEADDEAQDEASQPGDRDAAQPTEPTPDAAPEAGPVEAAVRGIVAGAAQRPIEDHPELFEQAHQTLRDALAAAGS